MVSSIALYAWRSVTTTMSDPRIYDAAIIVTLRSISVVLLSLIPLRCQSCLAWQPCGARDKVRNLHFNICNNPEPLDFQLNKQVRTITQKYSMMASGSLEMLSLHRVLSKRAHPLMVHVHLPPPSVDKGGPVVLFRRSSSLRPITIIA